MAAVVMSSLLSQPWRKKSSIFFRHAAERAFLPAQNRQECLFHPVEFLIYESTLNFLKYFLRYRVIFVIREGIETFEVLKS